MKGRITEPYNGTTGQWSHLNDKIRAYPFCKLGEGWPVESQFWSSQEGDQGVSRCLEYHQGWDTILPILDQVWATMALDGQVTRGPEDDFFKARSSLTLQTVEQIMFTFSFLNTERKGIVFFSPHNKMNIILKGKEGINRQEARHKVFLKITTRLLIGLDTGYLRRPHQ